MLLRPFRRGDAGLWEVPGSADSPVTDEGREPVSGQRSDVGRQRRTCPHDRTGSDEENGMATLTAWRFETADGAENALATLERLQKEELIRVVDAAVVSWPEGRKKPRTRELHNLAGAGALGGMFWGMLFGLIFLVPLLGAAVGAAMGAISGSMADVGISDDFIERVRAKVTPGTSALFAMTSDAVVDRVLSEFRGTGAELISTNLSGDQETRLRDALAEIDEEPQRA
jgi:uncharacterized membrane protein